MDDFPFVARILQEGFKHCQVRPAAEFMRPLGAEGATYKSMVVRKSDAQSGEKRRPRLPTVALDAFQGAASQVAMVPPVSALDCETRTAADIRAELQKCRSQIGSYVPPAAQVQAALPHATVHRQRSLANPPSARSAALPLAMPGSRQTYGFPQKMNASMSVNSIASPVLLGRSVCCPLPQSTRRQ